MLPREGKLAHLLGLLYEGTTDDNAWNPFLREVATAVGGESAAFMLGNADLDLHLISHHWGQDPEDLMPLGIPRLFGWCGSGPPEIRAEMRTVECNLSRLRETLAECESIWNQSAADARKVTTLGDVSLVVLSEDPAKNLPELLTVFEASQQELARLSSNSTRMVAYGSGHQIQKERPDLVVAAVQRVVNESRKRELSSQPQLSKASDFTF